MTAALLACFSGSCEDQPLLPSAPSELTAGVVVFDGVNFSGGSAHIQADVADLSKYKGPCEHDSDSDSSSYTKDWDDCVSSIRVSSNSRAIVYVDTNFKGWGVTIDKNTPSLEFVLGPCNRASVNDCISSIRVTSR
jgi:hypothetical protein